MNDADLKRMLETAVGDDAPMPSVAADLDRARAGLAARRRHRFRAATAAGALVTVAIGASLATVGEHSDAPSHHQVDTVVLVSKPLNASPYTFDLTPRGWEVQQQRASGVTIAPDDGSTSSSPYDFQGKLVILFDRNPLAGKRLEYRGRQIWMVGDSGYTTMAVATSADEPRGVVRIQYPNGTGWSTRQMLRFLASIHVGAGARPGAG